MASNTGAATRRSTRQFNDTQIKQSIGCDDDALRAIKNVFNDNFIRNDAIYQSLSKPEFNEEVKIQAYINVIEECINQNKLLMADIPRKWRDAAHTDPLGQKFTARHGLRMALKNRVYNRTKTERHKEKVLAQAGVLKTPSQLPETHSSGLNTSHQPSSNTTDTYNSKNNKPAEVVNQFPLTPAQDTGSATTPNLCSQILGTSPMVIRSRPSSVIGLDDHNIFPTFPSAGGAASFTRPSRQPPSASPDMAEWVNQITLVTANPYADDEDETQ
ncbi:hypothetical protein GX50_09001, partial [[Emmonsia] crescens]